MVLEPGTPGSSGPASGAAGSGRRALAAGLRARQTRDTARRAGAPGHGATRRRERPAPGAGTVLLVPQSLFVPRPATRLRPRRPLRPAAVDPSGIADGDARPQRAARQTSVYS